jgi:hypothetical protein
MTRRNPGWIDAGTDHDMFTHNDFAPAASSGRRARLAAERHPHGDRLLTRTAPRTGLPQGVLVQMVERGQILALTCEMPTCYSPNGRESFVPLRLDPRCWVPTQDHHPTLRSTGGTRAPSGLDTTRLLVRSWGMRVTNRCPLALVG